MKKYLIYSDPHFCQNSSIIRGYGEKYSLRLHNLIDSFGWAEKLADDEHCDAVINLGDTFDRSELNAQEITAFQDIKFSKLPHIILTGNHDSSVASLEYSSAQIFSRLGADVITSPKKVSINEYVDFYFIPYISHSSIIDLDQFLDNDNKKKILLTHNDLAGIKYGRFTSTSGFNVKDILNRCALCLDGHLHNGCVINNKIVLVGNLTGQNFNENAELYDHYAYILQISDDGSIDLEPRVNPYAFNFYKIQINSKNDLSKLDKLKNNAVVSISCASNLLTLVENKLPELSNVSNYKIIANYTNIENVSDEQIEFNSEDHLKQFIDFVQTKIPASDLLSSELAILGGK